MISYKNYKITNWINQTTRGRLRIHETLGAASLRWCKAGNKYSDNRPCSSSHRILTGVWFLGDGADIGRSIAWRISESVRGGTVARAEMPAWWVGSWDVHYERELVVAVERERARQLKKDLDLSIVKTRLTLTCAFK